MVVNQIFALGSTKLDDMSVFKGFSCSSNNTRTTCTKIGGGSMIVTSGKTLKIFHIKIMHTTGNMYYGTLAYDNDGAGTGEVILAYLTQGSGSGIAEELDTYMEVPAGKYVTWKGGNASQATIILASAIEV